MEKASVIHNILYCSVCRCLQQSSCCCNIILYTVVLSLFLKVHKNVLYLLPVVKICKYVKFNLFIIMYLAKVNTLKFTSEIMYTVYDH